MFFGRSYITSVVATLRGGARKVPDMKPWGVPVRTMANQRHKKIIKAAKGYRGRANRCYTMAKRTVDKARQNMYKGRKMKKREFRTLWIQRINAGSSMYGLSYRRFIHGCNLAGIGLNRKVLADIAVTEPLSFRSVVEVSKMNVLKWIAEHPGPKKKVQAEADPEEVAKVQEEMDEEKAEWEAFKKGLEEQDAAPP